MLATNKERLVLFGAPQIIHGILELKDTNAVNTGVKTWLGETKFVFLCPRDGLSGTLTDLTQLHVPEIHQPWLEPRF